MPNLSTIDLQHKVLEKQVDGVEDTTDGKTAARQKIVDADGNAAVVTSGGRLKVDADLTGGTVNVTATSLDIEDVTISDVGTTDDSLKVKHTGDVSTKSQTQYSDSTSNTQYWLGLEEDGQLSLQYVDTSVSNQKTISYALPSVVVGGDCLARRYYLSGSDVTGELVYIGEWTQTMDDLIKPPITDIVLSANTTVEDQVAGTVIGALSAAGGEPTISFSMTSNGGLDVEVSGTNLVVASGGIAGNAAGSSPFTVGIRATDSFGKTYDENMSVVVTSNDITDIALSANTIPYGSAADTAIGTLSYTGGVGTITPTITSAGGMTNLRLDGNVLEAGPSYMNTAVGSHTVRITATDEASTPQTYYEDLTIEVTSTAITDITLDTSSVTSGDPAGTDIGNLACTGGVGDVSYAVTSDGGLDNLKITDTGSSTGLLEVDTGGIIDSAGTYTIRITATDTVSQTYYEDFVITVASGFSNHKAVTRTATTADLVYNDHSQSNSYWFGSGGTGNMYLDDWYMQRTRATDNYSISVWFKVTGSIVDDTETYPLISSGSNYGNATGPLILKEYEGAVKVGFGAYGVMYHTPASSVDVSDGEWHHCVITWSGTANSPVLCTSTNTSQVALGHLGSSGSYDVNLKVYIDGEVCAFYKNTDYDIGYMRNVKRWNSTLGGYEPTGISARYNSSNSYTSSVTGENWGWGFGYMPSSGLNDILTTNFDEYSFHDVELTATQVGELYNSGTPVDLSNDQWTAGTWTTANCLCWWRMFEGDNDNNTTIESMAVGPNGDGTIDLYDWDDTAGSEGYVASSPARTVTPTIKIMNGDGSEVITLTSLADGDVYIP